MINLDTTINIGHVLTIFTIAGGGLIVMYTIKGEVAAQGKRIGRVEDEMIKQTDILVNLARQDERMRGFETRVEKLEKGKEHRV